MPNWVRNKVRAVNKADTEKLIAMLVKTDSVGNRCTNFNGIIPMPDELRDMEVCYGDEECKKKMNAYKEKYGYESWYDFSCSKWGTKWDSNEVFIDNDVVEFDTAWSMPYGIYQQIAKTIPILVAYANEDIGYNYGIVQFNADDDVVDILVNGTDAQIAHAIWGMEYDPDCEWEATDDFSNEVAKEVNSIIYNK